MANIHDGTTWSELKNELLTPEEQAELTAKAKLMGEIVKARKADKISQRELEEISGVSQPVIARMERGITSPQIDTLLKILVPLGKTLKVVDIKES